MLRVRQTDRNRQRQKKRGKDRDREKEKETAQGPGDEAVMATNLDLTLLNSQSFYHACCMDFKVTPFFLFSSFK